MRRQPLVLVVNLQRRLGDPQIYLLLFHVLIGAGIPIPVIHDVEIQIDCPAVNPVRNFVRQRRQRMKILLFFLEDFRSAAFSLLEWRLVEFAELFSDCLIQFGQGVEGSVSQLGNDRGCDLSDRPLHRGLLLRLPDTRRHDGGHVMETQ